MEFMAPRVVVSLCLGLMVLAAGRRALSDDKAPSGQKARFTDSDTIPVLRLSLLPPKDANGFVKTRDKYGFGTVKEEWAGATDKEAGLKIATAWLRTRFELPAESELVARVDASSKFQVFFDQYYRGVKLGDAATVGIEGADVIWATCSIQSVSEIEGTSAAVVDPGRARQAAMRALTAKGLSLEAIQRGILKAPVLEFGWSPQAQEEPHLADRAARRFPVWRCDKDGVVYVDAYTGRGWFDD